MSLTNGNRVSKTGAKAPRLAKGEPADWAGIDAETLRDCIAAAGAVGCALRFGYSRDGGCYAVGVYGVETQPYTEYPRPGTDVEGFLRQLAELFRNMDKPIIG